MSGFTMFIGQILKRRWRFMISKKLLNFRQKVAALASLGANDVASEPINDGPVALGLRSADTGLRDSYASNYFADRSFTNLDKYEVVDSLSTVDTAKLGK